MAALPIPSGPAPIQLCLCSNPIPMHPTPIIKRSNPIKPRHAPPQPNPNTLRPHVNPNALHPTLIPSASYDPHVPQVQPQHSWDSPARLTNHFLFKLQRHADHHSSAGKRYHTLQAYEESPQLPAGYATMIVLAFFPPLWRAVMHPRLMGWRAAQKGQVFRHGPTPLEATGVVGAATKGGAAKSNGNDVHRRRSPHRGRELTSKVDG